MVFLVFPNHSCQLFIFQLCFIHFFDAPHIVGSGVDVLQLDLALQQSAHLCVVAVCQKVSGNCFFFLLSCVSDVVIGHFHLLRRTCHFCRLLSGSFLRKPPHAAQFRQGSVHRVVKVPLRPRLKGCSVFSVIVIQRSFNLLNALAHLKHPLQLVRRVHNGGREQCRILFAQSCINHVHRCSVVCDLQRAHGRFSERIVIRDVGRVLCVYGNCRVSQGVLQFLVLVIVFRVSLNAPFIGFLKQRVQTFLRNFAVPQIFVGNASHQLLQIASLHAHGNAQCPTDLSQQRVFGFLQLCLRLCGNGGGRQLRRDVVGILFSVQNILFPFFCCLLLLLLQIPETPSLCKLSFQLRHDVVWILDILTLCIYIGLRDGHSVSVDSR